MNELIFIIITLIISGTIITIYHFYQKKGLKYLLIIITILYLIMSFKTTKIFNTNINLNIISTSYIYLLALLLLEKHSKKEFEENKKLLITTIIFTTIVFLIFILFDQSINDNIILNQNHLIDYIPIIISYITLPLYIILLSTLYKYTKTINKSFNINAIIATFLTCIIETTISTTIIYILKLDIKYTVQLILANYLIKIIIILFNLGINKIIMMNRKWLSWIIF